MASQEKGMQVQLAGYHASTTNGRSGHGIRPELPKHMSPAHRITQLLASAVAPRSAVPSPLHDLLIQIRIQIKPSVPKAQLYNPKRAST